MHLRNIRIPLSIIAALLANSACAEQCVPSGLFFRSHSDQLKVESVDSNEQPNTASFRLMILGNLIQDAPTIGRAEGEMVLTEDHCLGVYSAGNSCTLVFSFLPRSAKLRQIGNCSFGAGAHAEGTFDKTTKPERYMP
jgi:hypothetical protein